MMPVILGFMPAIELHPRHRRQIWCGSECCPHTCDESNDFRTLKHRDHTLLEKTTAILAPVNRSLPCR
jgi:hypothetical protein